MNIYERINAVRTEVEYVQKDATVQGYRAVTHDMVTAVLRASLVKHGIIILPSLVSSSVTEGQTSNGKFKLRYEAIYAFTFVNIEDKDDSFVVQVEAHADDSGDKAPGKCLSYATKYAMLKVFSLETGENEESRMEGARQYGLLVEQKYAEAMELIDEGDDLGIFCLGRVLGPDVWTDVYNQAPNGKKQDFKKKITAMEQTGHKVLQAINQGILQDDDLQVKENVEGLSENNKRLLAQVIGEEKTTKLKELLARGNK